MPLENELQSSWINTSCLAERRFLVSSATNPLHQELQSRGVRLNALLHRLSKYQPVQEDKEYAF
jgi:hypothetical protein